MITDILIQLVSTLVDKGFELPIYIFVVSINDNVVVARYEGNPPKEKTKVHILLEDIKSADWKLPINCFFVDSKGRPESIKVDPESFADTSESIH
jgi:hypothetical protein